MKAWFVDFGGGLESLRSVNVPRPVPAPGQVLVQVEAVSLNRRELSVLEGRYPLPVKDTLIPACDGVGTIVEVGDGVPSDVVGDRVVGAVFPEWLDGPFSLDRSAQLGGSLDGMLAEYVCLYASAVVPIPKTIAVVQAACLPCAGVTAWHALRIGGPLRPGDTVLTTTSGGVSTYTIQVAKALGYRVIVATSTASRSAALTNLGADHVLTGNASSRDVLELTESRGADRTVHIHGDINQSIASTKVGASVAVVSPAGSTAIDPHLAFSRNVGIHPISLGGVHHTRALVEFVAAHDIRVPIAACHPFEQSRAAYTQYIEQRTFGKVVIRVHG
jgi:NADPH:quinone reductase-like Zn-dependent oxidoreductase